MKLRIAKKVWRGPITWLDYRPRTWRAALHRLVKSDRLTLRSEGP